MPSYAKPPVAPTYSNKTASVYNNYSTQAPASSYAAPPAAAKKSSGLGLVTAGAFFIALAVGMGRLTLNCTR